MPEPNKIDFNAIVRSIKDLARGGEVFGVHVEEYAAIHNGYIPWCAYVKSNNIVRFATKTKHREPIDALLDLYLICGGVLDP